MKLWGSYRPMRELLEIKDYSLEYNHILLNVKSIFCF